MSSDSSIDFTELFNLLNDPLRLAILEELAAARAAVPSDPSVSFSELRQRVGSPDSGTFNYHLNQLRGEFVRKGEDGYVLSPSGHQFTAMVASGGIGSESDQYPHQLEDLCPGCDEPLTLDFQNGLFGARCLNDHWFTSSVPTSVVCGRPVDEAVTRFAKYTWSRVEFARDGICPACYHDLECRILEVNDGGDRRFEFEGCCHECGGIANVTVEMLSALHPTVLRLYLADDPSFRERPFWAFENMVTYETSVIDREPLRLAVTFYRDDDEIALSVSETGEVELLP